MLHRFWVSFAPGEKPSPLNWGCGVTAASWPDAERLIRDLVFPVYGEREIVKVVEDVDVSTLEEGHVRPNMGNPVCRGIRFPLI